MMQKFVLERSEFCVNCYLFERLRENGFPIEYLIWKPREHEGTERDTEGVGCDMS